MIYNKKDSNKIKYQDEIQEYKLNIKFDPILYYSLKKNKYDEYYSILKYKFDQLSSLDRQKIIDKYIPIYNQFRIDNNMIYNNETKELFLYRLIKFYLDKMTKFEIYKLYLYIEEKRHDIDKSKKDMTKYHSINIIK